MSPFSRSSDPSHTTRAWGPRRHYRLAAPAAVMLLAIGLAPAASTAAPAALRPPEDVRADAGNNTAHVSWSAPSGADPESTYYRVRAIPSGQTEYVDGAQTDATLRFLDNGTAATFVVKANQDGRWSAASEPSAPVTPQDTCTVRGTAGDDVLIGTAGDDALCGLGGDDVLRGRGGGDTFIGGAGTDTVDFRKAPDRVFAFLPGVAHLHTAHGLGWADGDGADVVRADIEALRGSKHADELEGDDAANRIVGGGGADLIRGWGGDDVIVGSGGRDELWGLSGADRLRGRAGDDMLMPRGGADTVNGGRGSDTITFTSAVRVDLRAGTAESDSSDVLRRVENVQGSPQTDVIRGSVKANALRGGGGDDRLLGLAGNDRIAGQGGADRIDGGPGTDRCRGGGDRDIASRCESLIGVP